MRPHSFLVLVVLVILGALGVLAAHAAVTGGGPYKGQDVNKGHVLVKGQGPFRDERPVKVNGPLKTPPPPRFRIKPGSCPKVLIKCAMMNPPNACMRDSECQGAKKCCEGSCGMACLNPK